MPLNQDFNTLMMEYLLSVEFKDSEFKDIFEGFITRYPNLAWENCYQKLYRMVRNLANEKLISISKRKNTFRYSTNYHGKELDRLVYETEVDVDLKGKLQTEAYTLNTTIQKKRMEIDFLDMYIKEYPILKNTIRRCKKKTEEQLTYLESKFKVLEMIRMTI